MSLTIDTARQHLLDAYKTGQSAAIKQTAEELAKKASAQYVFSLLSNRKSDAEKANKLDHLANRVLVAVKAADQHGWSIDATGRVLESIQS